MVRYRLICTECDRENSVAAKECEFCSGQVFVTYNIETLTRKLRRDDLSRRQIGLSKWKELLPVSDTSVFVSLGEGGTYLQKCGKLADALGIRRLFVKNETTNPTGAFVDRGTAIEVTFAREQKHTSLTCISTGNLGASLSAYAARAGTRCTVYLPMRADVGKLYQMIAYNATIHPVRDYGEAIRLSSDSKSYLVLPSSPFFLEGLKTTGCEIAEQLGWKTPDRIITPMGDGAHLSMIWKGISELVEVGLLDDGKVAMTGVQAYGCAPIVEAFRRKSRIPRSDDRLDTLAIDIAMPQPLLGETALETISNSDGAAISVTDRQMIDSMSMLARLEGIFAEPAAASTIAALRKGLDYGEIDRNEEIVCVVTGSGLKDPATAKKLVERHPAEHIFASRVQEPSYLSQVGQTKIMILRLLSEQERHGYGLWRELSKKFSIDIKLPTIYQHLVELVKMGLVDIPRPVIEKGRPAKKSYSITGKGRDVLRRLGKLVLSSE